MFSNSRKNPELEGSLNLTVHTDADWSKTRSTSGGIIHLNGTLLQVWSRTQNQTALSSCESEFYAIVTGVTEGMFIRSTLSELQPRTVCQIRIHTDSSSAMQLAQRQGAGRVKHLNIRTLFVQDLVKEGIVTIWIGTQDNMSDIFTKYLSVGVFQRRCATLGIQVPRIN